MSYSIDRHTRDYQDYLARIEPYKGSTFYEQLKNNPYMTYQKAPLNFFQGLWSNITGDSSFEDRFYNERQTSALEYMEQVLDAQRQQNYDDPAAQLARRRSAGLNDDLNGGEAIGTGTPGEAVPDETPPETPYSDAISVAGRVAQGSFELFQSAASLFGFFQDIAGKRLDNAAKDIALTDSGYDSIIKLLAGSSALPETRDEYEGFSEAEKKSLDDELFDTLEKTYKFGDMKDMYSTKRVKRLMKLLRGTAQYDKDGRPTLAYQAYRDKLLAQRYGDHKTTAGVIGTPGFSEDVLEFGSKIAETYGAIDLAIRDADKRIKEASARSGEAQAGYDETYYGTVVDGVSVAQSDARAAIAGNVASEQQAKNQKIVEDVMAQINGEFDKLNQWAKSGNDLKHVIMRLLIPYARARIMDIINNGLMNTLTGTASNSAGAASDAAKAAKLLKMIK